jgi:hypothetical protein
LDNVQVVVSSNTYYTLIDIPQNDTLVTISSSIANGSTNTKVASLYLLDSLRQSIIPPGQWELNLYVSSDVSSMSFYFKVTLLTSSGTITTLATSPAVLITNSTSLTKYDTSVFVPGTTIAANQNVMIEVYVNNPDSSSRNFTAKWGDNTAPSFLRTTLGFTPVMGSTGPIGPTGPAGQTFSIQFDGGGPSNTYSMGPVFDCGNVTIN